MIDPGLEFEDWITCTLPWQLNLSPSKEVAVKTKFGPFADFVRPLAKKAPEEFEVFFTELKKRFLQVSNWRSPKGTTVISESYKREVLKYPNGKPRHRLI